MSTPTAYPLQWPAGWQRTESRQRNAKMKASVAQALAFLQGELSRLGARQIILSSNYTIGIQSPKDPGVCAFFELRGKRYAIPCDRWDKIEHNIQAMFSGFKALPTSFAHVTWKRGNEVVRAWIKIEDDGKWVVGEDQIIESNAQL